VAPPLCAEDETPYRHVRLNARLGPESATRS